MASEERLRDVTPSATAFDPRAAEGPPARARAVVVGGGIIGASVALHLARLGWTDTVVLERSRVSSGTSWHAAGLMTRTRGTHAQTELASYSRDFYRELAALSGVDVGYYPNGSLSLARTPERLTELRYALTLARHHGLPAREVTREEIAAVSPLLAVDDLAGGVLFEEDATVNPGWATFATAKAAADLGVRVVEGARVTGFRVERGRVTGVETDRGAVRVRGRRHRRRALVARPRPARRRPARRCTRRSTTGRRRSRWRARAATCRSSATSTAPSTCATTAAASSSARSSPTAGRAPPRPSPRTSRSASSSRTSTTSSARSRRRARAMPALAEARFAHYLCAPESFTPDGNFLLGETAEVAGLFVAAGMNSQGIILGPGAGRALAEWIDVGAPTVDAADVDVRRFSPAQAGAGYLFERTRESLGRLYAMHWPHLQPGTARGLRRVPLYDRLAAAGACFGEAAGWERADWYAPPGQAAGVRVLLRPPELVRRRGRRAPRGARGRRAVRPLLVRQAARGRAGRPGDGPARLHRRPGPAARVRRVHLDAQRARRRRARRHGHTPQRRRLPRRHLGDGADQGVPLAAPLRRAGGRRDRRHLRPRGALGDRPALPRACWRASRRPTSAAAPSRFATARGRSTSAGRRCSPCASRSPASWAGSCTRRSSRCRSSTTSWSTAGAGYGLRHAGYLALDGLRAEKGYVHWGADAGPADTPDEAGLGFTVAMDKPGGFIGREALLAAGAPRRRLVPLLLADPEPLLYHGESVLQDGRVVGRVTSGAYGHTLGAAVGLAALDGDPETVDADRRRRRRGGRDRRRARARRA